MLLCVSLAEHAWICAQTVANTSNFVTKLLLHALPQLKAFHAEDTTMQDCVRKQRHQLHSRCMLSLDTPRATATKGTGQGKVNVLLAVHTHKE